MNTKTALSVFSALLFCAVSCFGQGTPDCQWTDMFTHAIAGPPHPNSSGGASPCVAYRVTYEAKKPMNALTLQLEGAPWNAGGTGPGTFVAITGSAIVQGSNPMIDPANATVATTGTVYYPFVRLNMTVFTPTGASGTVTARIYGYKGTSAAVPSTGGGGGGGTIASTLNLLAGDNAGNAIDSTIPYTSQPATSIGIGVNAGLSNAQPDLVAIGDNAANGNTGSVVVAIGGINGVGAAQGNTGDVVVAIGAGSANSTDAAACVQNTGSYVICIGPGAAELNSGTDVVAIGGGYDYGPAAAGNTGLYVIALGDAAVFNTGTEVEAFGDGAALNNTGSFVQALGDGAALNNTGSHVQAMGDNAAAGNQGNWVTAIGVDAAAPSGGAGHNPYNNIIVLTNSQIDFNGNSWQPTQDNDIELGDPSFAITRLYGNVSTYGGSLTAMALPTPAAPTVTPTCAGGCTQTWGYEIVAVLADGTTTTATSPQTTTAAQNATLDGTHSNLITCTEVPGASFYQVRRSTVATSPATTGIIGTLAYLSCSTGLVDDGLPGDNSPDPTVNATGRMTAGSLAGAGNAYMYADATGQFHRAPGSPIVAGGSQDLSGIGSISGGACAAPLTTAAPGVATSDVINASFNGDPTGIVGFEPGAMLAVIPYPSADNVNFRVCNNTALPLVPGAISINWTVGTGGGTGGPPSGAAGGDLGGNYPDPNVINGAHLTSGSTKVAQKFFGTAPPTNPAGNLPGDSFTDTTNHNQYVCNAPAGTAAPACTSVAAAEWLLVNTAAYSLPAATASALGGVTLVEVAQKFFGTVAPTNPAGNLPGDLYTDTTAHNEYVCNAPSGTAAPACTSVSAAGWLVLATIAAPVITSGAGPVTVETVTGFYWNNYTGVMGYNLPTITSAMVTAQAQFCFQEAVGRSGALTLTAPASTLIDVNGATNSTPGSLVSSGALGDSACIVAVSTTLYAAFVGSGSWANN